MPREDLDDLALALVGEIEIGRFRRMLANVWDRLTVRQLRQLSESGLTGLPLAVAMILATYPDEA